MLFRYKAIELLGAGFVIIGTLLCTRSTGTSTSLGSLDQNFDPIYAIVFTLSFLFMNLSIILKEKVFKEAPKKLNGKQLDLFIVNSFGSLFQVHLHLNILIITLCIGDIHSISTAYFDQFKKYANIQIP